MNFITKNLGLPSLFIIVLMTGCVSKQAFIPDTTPAQWQLSGKIGLVYPKPNCSGEDCGNQSDQGRIAWKQDDRNYTIIISDPFERIIMTLVGNAKVLTATHTKQEPIVTTPDDFIALLTNNKDNQALSNLSPSWLQYWVTGRPSPQLDIQQQTSESFIQSGYRIRPTRWKQTAIGQMPRTITITKDEFTLRLAVKQWSKL